MTLWGEPKVKAFDAPLSSVRPEHKNDLVNFKSLIAEENQISAAVRLGQITELQVTSETVSAVKGLATTRRAFLKMKSALGRRLNKPSIGRAGRAVREVAFNRNAYDGNNDGTVQDGTRFERPAPSKSPKNTKRQNPKPLSIKQESLRMIRKRFKEARARTQDPLRDFFKKKYGSKKPPPWEAAAVKVEKIQDMIRTPEGRSEVLRWVSSIYEHDEVEGRKHKFRTKLNADEVELGFNYIQVEGVIEAFNKETQEWEEVGLFQRTLSFRDEKNPQVLHGFLAFGDDAQMGSEFANSVKRDGFAKIFNNHAFVVLKASNFKRAIIDEPSWEGAYVWARSGFRSSEVDSDAIKKWADAMEWQLKEYRRGSKSIIRTDLDAQLIEYLIEKAKINKYDPEKSPHQHDYIMALEDSSKDSDSAATNIKNFIYTHMPLDNSAILEFTGQNVPRDPRTQSRAKS